MKLTKSGERIKLHGKKYPIQYVAGGNLWICKGKLGFCIVLSKVKSIRRVREPEKEKAKGGFPV